MRAVIGIDDMPAQLLRKMRARGDKSLVTKSSAIHILAMSDADHQHRDALILYFADRPKLAQPIVAHAVAPQSAFVAVERLAPLTRVVRRSHPLPQKSDNRLLSRLVKFLYFFGAAADFDPPVRTRWRATWRSQAAAPTLPA